MRKGNPGDTFQWRGFEISGRRVGIVGLGNVGRRTAPIFKHGFNCHVTAYDPYITDAPFQQLDIDRANSLDALIASTDILVTHVPLNEETRGMIDAATMARMPKGAVIINAARGGVVDEEALFTALTSGHIFAAATDVFVTEPPAIDHPLLTLPNFLATPHIGAATHDSARRSGETVVRYVMDILDGHPP